MRWLWMALVTGCTSGTVPSVDTDPPPDTDIEEGTGARNVLFVLLDDVGLDSAPAYGVSSDPVRTPTLEALADRGLRFDRAWATPSCSPTRATVLTGTHPTTHGVTEPVFADAAGLPTDSRTLPAVVRAAGVATASFGKWHLGDEPGVGDDVPGYFGWDHFVGILGGATPDPFRWQRTEDGVTTIEQSYVTSHLVDEAITWVDGQESPWLLWLAFTAPHDQFHVAPPVLHAEELGPAGTCPPGEARACYRSALEALDTELGRLLDHLDDGRLDDTVVIVLGDNGTPQPAAVPPVDPPKAKDTVWEGGIRVPLFVAGPGVAEGASTERLTDAADLHPTILELLRVEAGDGPGVSLVPTFADPSVSSSRETVFSMIERPSIDPGDGRAVRDTRYKLIRWSNGTEALFDLDADPWEDVDLLEGPTTEALSTRDRLSVALDGT